MKKILLSLAFLLGASSLITAKNVTKPVFPKKDQKSVVNDAKNLWDKVKDGVAAIEASAETETMKKNKKSNFLAEIKTYSKKKKSDATYSHPWSELEEKLDGNSIQKLQTITSQIDTFFANKTDRAAKAYKNLIDKITAALKGKKTMADIKKKIKDELPALSDEDIASLIQALADIKPYFA